jgi:cytochrome c oxidase assembly protein subunit 17
MGLFSWFSGSKQEVQDDTRKKPAKKICCACPETKVRVIWRDQTAGMLFQFVLLTLCAVAAMQTARDECVALHGPESTQCQELIEAHKRCLRAEGFDVSAAQRCTSLTPNVHCMPGGSRHAL